MARPRSNARPITQAVYDPPSGMRLAPALRALIEAEDPAIPTITARVLEARLAGANVMDNQVIEQCIAQGRRDHADAELGGVA